MDFDDVGTIWKRRGAQAKKGIIMILNTVPHLFCNSSKDVRCQEVLKEVKGSNADLCCKPAGMIVVVLLTHLLWRKESGALHNLNVWCNVESYACMYDVCMYVHTDK